MTTIAIAKLNSAVSKTAAYAGQRMTGPGGKRKIAEGGTKKSAGAGKKTPAGGMTRIDAAPRTSAQDGLNRSNASQHPDLPLACELPMDSATKFALNRIEIQLKSLSAQLQTANDRSEAIERRLLDLIMLLTPQKSNDTPLSDLFAHLIMIGREQLNLSHKTLDSITALREDLGIAANHPDDASRSRRPQ